MTQTAPRPSHPAPSPGRGGQQPPHDLGAEGIVLSDVLEHPEHLDKIGFLQAEHFFANAHTQIYQAIQDLAAAGQEIDLVAVATQLRSQGQLERVGGAVYLQKLAYEQPACARIEQHALVVFERWRVRMVIAQSQVALATGFQSPADVQGYIEQYENALASLAYLNRRRGLELAADVLAEQLVIIQEAQSRHGTTSGVSSGFKDLDNLSGGFYDGDLTILGGRPGMGKTTLALALLRNVTKPAPLDSEELPLASALFSLEMPRDQLVVRLACAHANVPFTAVRKNTLTREHIERLIEAHEHMKRVPLWIDDTPALSIAELRARVRKLRRDVEQGTSKVPAKKIGLIVIDYLQLMTGIRNRGDSREQEISSISQGLKNLAKQEAVPILALAQLNRGVEAKSGRKDKRPQLSDLRESGAIEQDADNIWFVYREGYYDRAVNANETELILAKQRAGPIGMVKLYMDGSHATFKAMVKDSDAYDHDQDDNYYEDG